MEKIEKKVNIDKLEEKVNNMFAVIAIFGLFFIFFVLVNLFLLLFNFANN